MRGCVVLCEGVLEARQLEPADHGVDGTCVAGASSCQRASWGETDTARSGRSCNICWRVDRRCAARFGDDQLAPLQTAATLPGISREESVI